MSWGDVAGAAWTGWSEPGTSNATVTSRRLGPGAPVRNRLFPKIRSWFALGAPVELLSPLSVARLVLALELVVWPVLAAAAGWPGRRWWAVGTAVGLLAVSWLALLAVRRISPPCTLAVATGVAVVGGLVVWAGGDRATALAMVVTLVPVTAFAALFLRGRAVALQQAVAAAALAVGAGLGAGLRAAAVVSAASVVGGAAAAATIRLLVRTVVSAGEIDPLSGVLTGQGLAKRLADRPGGAVAVAAVHLGGLADVRDALGHRAAAELMRRAVEDVGQVMPDAALIGRVGDDDLVVAVTLGQPAAGTEGAAGGPGAVVGSAVDAAVPVASGEIVRSLVAAIGTGRYLAGEVEIGLRPHVGVAVGPGGATAGELVRQAVLSARTAERAGQTTAAWDGSDGTLDAADLALLADLRLAAERGELSMVYQPQVAAADGRVVAVEALIRWNRPGHGPVPPGRFVPLAERTGLIDRLTQWTFGAVLDAAARWRHQGIDLPVAVNVSARSVALPGLGPWILGQLADRGLPPEALTVEVTETAAADLAQVERLLRPLHEHGVRVSVDDFGTGYTSLAALPELPLDELKVDMRFVQRSATSAADAAIVRSVVELAHRLGLVAVAEGVEDEPLARAMADLGYDILQGYHFAMPLAEGDLLALVADRPPGAPVEVRPSAVRR